MTVRLTEELAAIAGDPAKPLASLSVLAIRDGRVAYAQQFGRRRIDEGDPQRDRAAGPRTLYRIASISKLVTTLGVMALVEDGRLDLDRDAGDYLGHPLRNPHFPSVPVTVRMMLTHTSSLRDAGGYYWPWPAVLRDELERNTNAIWSKDAAPGTYFSYANLPWGVVAAVLERVAGERFDRYMGRRILGPLKLDATFNPAALPPGRLADLATLYRKRTGPEGRETWNPKGPWIAQVDDYSREAPVPRAPDSYVPGTNGTLFAPQGGLRASAADLGTIARMLLGRGEVDGVRVLKASTIEAMLARQWTRDGRNGAPDYGNRKARFNGWGLGNQHFTDRTGPATGDRLVEGGGFVGYGHLGDAWGLTSAMVVDPARHQAIVYLSGGSAFDPDADPGAYSAFSRYEERIFTALHRHVLS